MPHAIRPVAAGILCLLSILSASWTHARGETGDESALAASEGRAAPLAVSGDGQWRVHVDRHGVLHRVSLADPKQDQPVKLPFQARRIATSKTAQKVAFTTELGCIGLVDFGDAKSQQIKLSWIITRAPGAQAAIKVVDGPAPPTAEQCKTLPQRALIAMSSDGKLVADVAQVMDLESQTVVASLPGSTDDVGRRRTLDIQFTDNNSKLFLATATLGEGYESPDSPHDMQFSLWDLRKKSLFNLEGGPRQAQFVPEMFIHAYSSQTGALNFVRSDRYFEARAKADAQSESLPLLDLMQTNLHACGSKPTTRFALPAWQWTGFVVDPLGRWIAGIRPAGAEPASAGPGRRGGRAFAEELQIVSMSTGRLIDTVPMLEPLHGMAVTPDGRAIVGVSPLSIDPMTGLRHPVGSPKNTGGEVRQIPVHPDALAGAKAPAQAVSASACPLEDELAGARNVQKVQRTLVPVWSRKTEALNDLRNAIEIDLQNKKLVTDEQALCTDMDRHGVTFVKEDQSLWLDKYTELVNLDWKTGQPLSSSPTARKRSVCSNVVPEAGGIVHRQGDTVTFQSFEGKKTPVEIKRGWTASEVIRQETRPPQRTFGILWAAKLGTDAPKDKEGQSLDAIFSTHDMATKKKIADHPTQSAMLEMGFSPLEASMVASDDEFCAWAKTSGKRPLAVSSSHFDSVRARQCKDQGSGLETIFWSGLDLNPRKAADPLGHGHMGTRVVASGESVVVAIDGSDTIRIFDAPSKRELGQIPTSSMHVPGSVRLSEKDGIVVIEFIDNVKDNLLHTLRAYSYK